MRNVLNGECVLYPTSWTKRENEHFCTYQFLRALQKWAVLTKA